MQQRWVGWALPATIAVGAGLLFGLTWTDAIQSGEGAELVVAACNGGVIRPPGYPLYAVLGNLICRVPLSTPAGRVGALSVLAGAWALLALYATVVRLSGARWAGAAAVLLLGAGTIFRRQASLVDVFALNAALCMTTVYVALRAAEATTSRARVVWGGLAGLAMGLAVSNHHSSLVVAPLLLLALHPSDPFGPALARTVATVGGALAGLLPHLYLLLASPDRLPRWGETSTWPGLLQHMTERSGGTVTLHSVINGEPFGQVGQYLATVPRQTAWVLWPLALIGLAALFARAFGGRFGQFMEGRARRDVAFLLGLLPVIAGPGYLLLFDMSAESTSARVIEAYHVLPDALLALCFGVGLVAVERAWLSAGRGVRYQALFRACVLGGVVASAAWLHRGAGPRGGYVVEDYGKNALAAAGQGALILGVGDAASYSVLYAQQILKLRPDVEYVDVSLLVHPWYVTQKLRARPSLAYRFEEGRVDSLGLIMAEVRRGVPVYLATMYSEKVRAAFGGYPVGPLFRVALRGTVLPRAQEVVQMNERLFRDFARRGPRTQTAPDPATAALLEHYADTWQSIAAVLEREGDHAGALRAIAHGREWAPWMSAPEGFGKSPPRPRRVRTD